MSWGFSPLLPAGAQLLVDDGAAIGAGVTVSPDTLTGSASGYAFSLRNTAHTVDVPRRAVGKSTAAVRFLLLLATQLVVASGSGVSDTASAPSGSASGGGSASGAGVTATTSAPSGSATGNGAGTANGAGVSDTASAPSGSATGGGAATGGSLASRAASAPIGLASGQTNALSVSYTTMVIQRVFYSRRNTTARLVLLMLPGGGQGAASGTGADVTTVAPSGSASGGGTIGFATGAGVTATAFPPYGVAIPPYRFSLRNQAPASERRFHVPRPNPRAQLLLLSQGQGQATGFIPTAAATAPDGGGAGNFLRIRLDKFFPPADPAAYGRRTPWYLQLLNSFMPDYPVRLQVVWDESALTPQIAAGRRYPWTLFVLGQATASVTGAIGTVTTSAPTAFATGDGAGLATGTVATATTSAPSAVGAGNTNAIASIATATASVPTGTGAGQGSSAGVLPPATASAPDGGAAGGGSGVAVGVIDTADASAPVGAAGVFYIAVGALDAVTAFEANGTASGAAVAVGGIFTVSADAPQAGQPVKIGDIEVTVVPYRSRVTIA
jgi:hypothetical protein